MPSLYSTALVSSTTADRVLDTNVFSKKEGKKRPAQQKYFVLGQKKKIVCTSSSVCAKCCIQSVIAKNLTK